MSHGKKIGTRARCSEELLPVPSEGKAIPVFLSPATIFGIISAKNTFAEPQTAEAGSSRKHAKRNLEIHGLPSIAGSYGLEIGGRSVEPYEEAWPLLSGSPSCENFKAEACSSWATRAGARKLKFSLGDCQEWPSLHETERKITGSRSKGEEEESRCVISGDPDLLAAKCTASGAGSSRFCSDERADIPRTKAPTQRYVNPQQVRGEFRGDGFLHLEEEKRGAIEGGGSRGWMRLPPIVMQQQQQQKRSRQAAFFVENATSAGLKSRNGESSSTSGASDLPPVYLMLNKDFIVISPLKENLLLTLALTHRRPVSPTSEAEAEQEAAGAGASGDGGCSSTCGGKRIRRQVFVGRFEAFSSFVRFGLGRDAQRVVTECNAGGTSTISESLSVEYFVRKFKAKDVVTEMEVEYCAMNWKKVDYICSLSGQRVGVSVTRAMSYPNPEDFSAQMAYRLLYKKLFGLVVARHGVTDRHSFSQCILHVWCETTTTAKLLEAQYKEVSEELDITDDVIMVLTVAEGWHARPIFYESCLVKCQGRNILQQ